MSDTLIDSRFAGADIQAKTKEAADAAVQALESLHGVSPAAAGLVAHAAAAYFDGISKLALISQAILLKKMAGDAPPDTSRQQAVEDALGVLATNHFMDTAAAIAAAIGALEAESAHGAIDQIDQSIAKYAELLRMRGADTRG